MRKIKIAIDGPAGSGKSTTARIVAGKLGYLYADTGAMYRAVTLAWLESGTGLSEEEIIPLMQRIKVELKYSQSGQRTFLDGRDVSDDIRSPDVTKFVSPVSALGSVRSKMVEQQREIGRYGGIVMDGRDIGTVVFPDAELKIFLVASIQARAARRSLEFKSKGIIFDNNELIKQIADRDKFDSSRENSPLRKADGAIEIDTSELTIEQQTQLIIDYALEIMNYEL